MKRAILSLLSLATLSLRAETLVHFNFMGNAGNEASVAPMATAPALTMTTALARSNLSSYTEANSFGVRPISSHNSTLATAVSNNRYVGFVFSVNNGFSVSLEAIDFGWLRQNAKDRNFTVMASLDGGATGFTVDHAIDTETVTTANLAGSSHSLDLSGDARLQDIAAGTTVQLRMYFHGDLNQYEGNALTSKNGLPGLKLVGSSEIALGDEPVCVITAPAHNTLYPYGSYPAPLPVEVTVEDQYGIAEVRFYESGQLIGTETDAPYTFNWNWTPQQGTSYFLEARAENIEGFIGISQTVRVDTGLDQPPTVAITSPVDSTSYPQGGYPASILIQASATDDSGVALVTFLANGEVIGTDDTAPYALDWAWPATEGIYVLTAVAKDDSGNTTASRPVYIEALGKLPAGLLAYDNFQRAAPGAIHGARSGVGWNAAWNVQGGNTQVPGYNIAEEVPLSYGPIVTTPQYAVGGRAYLGCKRRLDVSAGGPFADYLTGSDIGASGTELWASYLYRRDGAADAACQFVFARGIGGDGPQGTPVLQTRNLNGEWVVQHSGVEVTTVATGKACVAGETVLFVVRFAFGAGETAADHVASVYVNPPESSLGGTPPATPTVVLSIFDENFRFDGIHYYPAAGASQGSVDEIRFGTSYAAVTPTTANPGMVILIR